MFSLEDLKGEAARAKPPFQGTANTNNDWSLPLVFQICTCT